MVNIDEAIIAKYEYCGEHFEILVDPDLAADFRNPDGPDVAIEDLLAVEEIFNVKVEKVNILNTPDKQKRLGRYTGTVHGYRKAIVKLAQGYNIDLYNKE